MNVSRAQLQQIPWLDLENIGDRAVDLMPVFDGARWTMWLHATDGRMLEIHPVDVGSGTYLANAPAEPTDLSFMFLELVWQHLSWPSVARSTSAIMDDIENLAGSLAKIDFFWEHRAKVPRGLDAFVRSETEYLLIVARSLLDHLHEVIVGVWGGIRLVDEERQRKKKQCPLPPKLSKTCLADNKVRSAEDLQVKYALAPLVAHAYQEVGEFVATVRRLRDGVVHQGKTTGPIYVVPRGFGVGRKEALARALPTVWKPEHAHNEHVLSLRPLLAHIALQALYSCNTLASAMLKSFAMPPALAPAHRVFYRMPHADALLRAQGVLGGVGGWWAQEESEQATPPGVPAG